MFKILSDSACDLSQEYIKKHDVTIIPLSASLDGKNYYKDRAEINRDEFYQTMVDNPKLFPKTSLPSIEMYAEIFRKYASQNIPVICFTISLILSGSFNSARNAKLMVEEEYPNSQIYVVNSQQNTVTQALIIDQAVRMRDAGLSIDDINAKLPALMDSARIFFTVGSLDYLQIGGRIGGVAKAATGKLGVKPIIIMKDGGIGLGGIGRNRNKLKNNVIQVAKKYLSENGKDNFIISAGYGYDRSEGQSFLSDVENELKVKLNEETNVEIGVISAVHTGPHAIGIGVIKKFETL